MYVSVDGDVVDDGADAYGVHVLGVEHGVGWFWFVVCAGRDVVVCDDGVVCAVVQR